MTPKIAMCRSCENEPLVCTFAFYKKEFICMGCGRTYEWLQPASADETPELLALAEKREQEWNTLSGDFLPHGCKVADCDLCRTSDDYQHLDHATDTEKEAHYTAQTRINEFCASKVLA